MYLFYSSISYIFPDFSPQRIKFPSSLIFIDVVTSQNLDIVLIGFTISLLSSQSDSVIRKINKELKHYPENLLVIIKKENIFKLQQITILPSDKALSSLLYKMKCHSLAFLLTFVKASFNTFSNIYTLFTSLLLIWKTYIQNNNHI